MRLNKTEHAPVDRIQQGGRGDTLARQIATTLPFGHGVLMAIPRSDFKE
jgi:hypothetical protein